MSYQVVGGPSPVSKSRPGVVTTASILLYICAGVVAAVGAIGAISSIQTAGAIVSAQPNSPLGAGSLQTFGVIGAVLYVVLAGGFVTLAIQVGKGRNPARIVTWVVAGIVALCCGCGQVANVAGQSLISGLPADSGITPTQLQTTGLTIADAVLSVLLILLLVIVIVLLSVPAANDFFRREQEVWVPPAWPSYPGGGYPGAGYPQPPVVPQYPYQPQPQPQQPTQPQPPTQQDQPYQPYQEPQQPQQPQPQPQQDQPGQYGPYDQPPQPPA